MDWHKQESWKGLVQPSQPDNPHGAKGTGRGHGGGGGGGGDGGGGSGDDGGGGDDGHDALRRKR